MLGFDQVWYIPKTGEMGWGGCVCRGVAVRGEGVHRCQLSQFSSSLARNKRPEINLVMAAVNICKVKSLIRQRNLEQSEN